MTATVFGSNTRITTVPAKALPKKCKVIQSATYTREQRERAMAMKTVLELMYDNVVSIKYNKNFIALKVTEPKVVRVQQLALLELDYRRNGVTKTVTEYETVYTVERK